MLSNDSNFFKKFKEIEGFIFAQHALFSTKQTSSHGKLQTGGTQIHSSSNTFKQQQNTITKESVRKRQHMKTPKTQKIQKTEQKTQKNLKKTFSIFFDIFRHFSTFFDIFRLFSTFFHIFSTFFGPFSTSPKKNIFFSHYPPHPASRPTNPSPKINFVIPSAPTKNFLPPKNLPPKIATIHPTQSKSKVFLLFLHPKPRTETPTPRHPHQNSAWQHDQRFWQPVERSCFFNRDPGASEI